MKAFANGVDKHSDLILNAQNHIWANPETGYREWKTSAYLEKIFEDLGYELVKAGDIPGFYTVLDTGRPGPEVMILGELDSLICREHPDADKTTGAVHCCGHSAQCAALVGIAAALKDPGALDDLCGRIRLCAVPAEELIELEYRAGLMEQGTIRYFVGKPEFLRRGLFDGVDMAFMVHTIQDKQIIIPEGFVGCVAKRIAYKGVSAHAGGSPWEGCNALYAATLGLNAINSIRETFQEPDIIRVHPIITKGGGAVNAIPDRVTLESFVRGSRFDAIKDANTRVNRALCGGALSLGANVEINDNPGYAPLRNNAEMKKLAKEATQVLPDVDVIVGTVMESGSTDMGDLSCLMPVVHPYIGGASGTNHGVDYQIADPQFACVDSARWQLGILYLLLKEDACRAKEILAGFEPQFKSKEEYFNYVDQLQCTGDRILYTEGNASVTL